MLARAVAAVGFEVYAPDIRGHGASGRRGPIDRIGLTVEPAAIAAAVAPLA